MAGVIEYPPILTNNAQQDNYNLREYIIRNINMLQQVLLDNGGSMHIDENNSTGDINITINAEIEARPNLQEKTVNVTENGDFSVEADENKDGLSKVNLHVAVPEGTAYGTINISENGTHDVTDYATAEVDVQPDLQSKSVTITENGSQTVTPASGKDGLSSVAITVNVPTGANLQSKSVSPTSSEQEITPDSGYDGLSKVTVAGAPLQTRTVTPTAAAQQIEKSSSSYYGLQRVNINGDANLIPGNIRSGISIFGVNGSYSPSFQLQSKNVTPSGSAQAITPDSGYDGLSRVDVAAIALEAKSVTPSASQQVITPASGYNGLSKVTIAGDADLIASNIKKDVNIFGVIGTYEGGSAPITGSLIEITCSSNIEQVTATVNDNTYTAYLDTAAHKAYVTIPYTDTTEARTCVLRGYSGGTQVTAANVSMAAGVGYYTATLSTSAWVYNNGTWTGVNDKTWTGFSATISSPSGTGGGTYYVYRATLTAEEQSSLIRGYGAPTYYRVLQYYTYLYHTKPAAYLAPISSRGYSKVRIKVAVPQYNTAATTFRVGAKINTAPGPGLPDVYHDTQAAAGTLVYDEFTLDFGEPTEELYLIMAIISPETNTVDNPSVTPVNGYGEILEIQFV